ncbi:MAG: hypothetical protein NTW50_03675 [Candidatus Berkelbacteria bacterium]|nr:hypothetical protein [Candidatus Berkelbacteria bacterium]
MKEISIEDLFATCKLLPHFFHDLSEAHLVRYAALGEVILIVPNLTKEFATEADSAINIAESYRVAKNPGVTYSPDEILESLFHPDPAMQAELGRRLLAEEMDPVFAFFQYLRWYPAMTDLGPGRVLLIEYLHFPDMLSEIEKSLEIGSFKEFIDREINRP